MVECAERVVEKDNNSHLVVGAQNIEGCKMIEAQNMKNPKQDETLETIHINDHGIYKECKKLVTEE